MKEGNDLQVIETRCLHSAFLFLSFWLGIWWPFCTVNESQVVVATAHSSLFQGHRGLLPHGHSSSGPCGMVNVSNSSCSFSPVHHYACSRCPSRWPHGPAKADSAMICTPRLSYSPLSESLAVITMLGLLCSINITEIINWHIAFCPTSSIINVPSPWKSFQVTPAGSPVVSRVPLL